MSNELTVFKNEEFGEVRTVVIDNDPWFVGKDVASILGYSNPNEALQDHVEEEDKLNSKTLSSFQLDLGQRGGWLINESGLYSLVLSSKLKSAKRFKKWVTSEVLPKIREHGVYMTPDAIQKTLTDPDYIIQLATKWKEAEARVAVLAAENESMKPKAEYFDILVDRNMLTGIRDTAKEFGIKQNVFVNFLMDKKLLYRNNKGKLTPYAAAVDDGLFELKEFSNKKNGFSDTQTLVTPKGRESIRLLLDGQGMI